MNENEFMLKHERGAHSPNTPENKDVRVQSVNCDGTPVAAPTPLQSALQIFWQKLYAAENAGDKTARWRSDIYEELWQAAIDSTKAPEGEFPKHLTEHPHRLWYLQNWANRCAAFYRSPIYLCGSALIEFNENPRDWDLRMYMADDEFERRFGPVDKWVEEGGTGDWTEVRWRWSQTCVKECKDAWFAMKLNVDFQIYPVSHCEKAYSRQRKVRLDTHKFPFRRDEI